MEKKFNHYFITDKTREYKKHKFEFMFNGNKYFFVTEDGVFSKSQIDDGSFGRDTFGNHLNLCRNDKMNDCCCISGT